MENSSSEELEQLKKRYKISNYLFEQIAQGIIQQYTNGYSSNPSPTAIITGAQPGAGKTELQKLAEHKLNANIVICNADNFRDFHPSAQEIKSKYPEQYPELTAIYAQKWNDLLSQYRRDNQLNYILETTFSSGQRLNETIFELKIMGYNVDIMLLAVPPKLSLLGTYMRFEESIEKNNLGRKVSKEAHDSRFNAILKTINAISNEKLFDNIYIYSRSIVLKYTNLVEGVTLIAHNPKDIQSVFLEEINNEWQPKLKEYFKNSCHDILKKMEKRSAPQSEIDLFIKELGLEVIPAQKTEIPRKRGRRM
ncbi:MAG: zeta toxin family protein [Flavobacterium nitrogenifigens]|uniref:zeta toxin family protein n=1 Tax=Flavobacterium nitrogenifigens TaxID=1617283 RepID=UPI002806E742|nr:zeta toxin family protein [Flavobacterium nitrogenifigens]MDQ8015083.1 zeta toxin family protein [Flavobacterium nitrogenifigens]